MLKRLLAKIGVDTAEGGENEHLVLGGRTQADNCETPLLSRILQPRSLPKFGLLACRLRSEVNSELNFPPNFEGLVLGCIDADFCK